MGEEKRKDAKAGDAAESPRKALRLDQLAAAGVDPAGYSAAPPQESSGESSADHCKHVSMEVGQLNQMIDEVSSVKGRGMCEDCGLGVYKTKGGAGAIMVCTLCNSHFCSGVMDLALKRKPMGHARLHAERCRHWVALWFDDPFNGYCFSCEQTLNFDVSDGEDEDTWSDLEAYEEAVMSDGVDQVKDEVRDDAGGGTSGFDDGNGYIVRGMPNLGFTCYMNAVAQCLLALRKLRAFMLGPDAPSGLLGTTMHDLVVETSSANYARRTRPLNPQSLLEAIQIRDPGFVGMQDSHSLLGCLLGGLESELRQMQGGEPSAVAPATTASIFSFRLTTTIACNACSYTSAAPEELLINLTASMPSEDPPATSAVSPPMAKGCKSPTKPQSSICKELFPAIEESNTQKIQAIADGGESLIPGSELGVDVMWNAPKPLQVDPTEVKICQSKELVHGPLQTRKNRAKGLMIEVPIKFVDILSPALDKKSEGVGETIAGSHDPGRINSLTSIEVGLISNHFKEEKIVWTCENCKSTQVITSEMSCGEKDSTSGSTANKSLECHGDAQESVPSCPPTEKHTDLPAAHDSQNASTQNQDKGKQVMLDHSAHQKEDNQSEQKDMSKWGIRTTVISSLPPVLIIHVKRYARDGSKLSGHVSFEEILNVRPFMDPSCEDKDNSSYRLVGVVEHIGPFSAVGHYVAYVRAGHSKQGSGFSSWFCANDNIVKEVSLEKVLRCEAFLLFYERMED